MPSLVIMSTWGFGNAMVIFLAGLQGVPRHLYEAVSIDGGGTWQRFRHVTLPMMTPTIFYNLVTGVIGTFQVFNQAYVMTQGGPNNAIAVLHLLPLPDGVHRERDGLRQCAGLGAVPDRPGHHRAAVPNARRWVYYEMAGAR